MELLRKAVQAHRAYTDRVSKTAGPSYCQSASPRLSVFLKQMANPQLEPHSLSPGMTVAVSHFR